MRPQAHKTLKIIETVFALPCGYSATAPADVTRATPGVPSLSHIAPAASPLGESVGAIVATLKLTQFPADVLVRLPEKRLAPVRRFRSVSVPVYPAGGANAVST